MPLRRRRAILGVVVMSHLLTGCYSWKVVAVSPRALVDSAHVSAIRVKEQGGTKYVLNAPRVVGDSLMGTVRWVSPAGGMTGLPRSVEVTPRAIALTAIDHVAVRRTSGWRTAALVVSVPAVGVLWVLAAFARSGCCP